MKNSLLLHVFFCTLLICPSSCKKFIQQQKENALVDLVTNGTWRVSHYKDHQTDITGSFTGYVFQFRSNGTVDAVYGGQTSPGTWAADVNARTIQSDFLNAVDPLKKLNYVWKVTDSYSDSVSARTLVDSVYNYLELHKN
ncbi:MAG TPA: hypothetical protein VFC34_00250 [Puia sp.]|nr:hypothetical protein [Puia sp.]